MESCKEDVFYRRTRANVLSNNVASNNLSLLADDRNPISSYVNDETFALLYGAFGVKANTVR